MRFEVIGSGNFMTILPQGPTSEALTGMQLVDFSSNRIVIQFSDNPNLVLREVISGSFNGSLSDVQSGTLNGTISQIDRLFSESGQSFTQYQKWSEMSVPFPAYAFEDMNRVLSSADVFLGGNVVDRMGGGLGADQFEGRGGNDAIDGGSGIDTAVFSGRRSDYTVNVTASSVIVVDTVIGRDGTDTLSDIERLRFSDGTLALDISGNAAQAFRIYQAAFARTPDAGGVGFWTGQIDTGTTLQQVAASFIDSGEFRSLYGQSPSDASFVDALYQNVLGRAADAGGAAFWKERLSQGDSRAQVLLHFSESPENIARVAPAIQDGIWFV
jgi:Ca2+-binding RTX toxin-like protein